MVKTKAAPLQVATYMIELDSSVFDLHVYFSSKYDGPLYKQFRGQQDICHVTFAGTLCASSSPKVKLAIPVNITMEASEDTTCSVGFSVRKDKGNLYATSKRNTSSIFATVSKTGASNIWSCPVKNFSEALQQSAALIL